MAIHLKIKPVRFEQKWGRSCFFGSPDLPRRYLSKVGDEEVFIAQINLEHLANKLNSIFLPHRGMLYFFYDLEKHLPIVRYSESIKYNERDFSRVDFNDIIESNYDFLQEYIISFGEKESETSLLIEEDENLKPGEIILLRLCEGDFLKNHSHQYFDFIVNKDDILNLDYSKVRFIFHY